MQSNSERSEPEEIEMLREGVTLETTTTMQEVSLHETVDVAFADVVKFQTCCTLSENDGH